MVRPERKKEMLEYFTYEKIKGDVSYSALMKKTGSNCKGYLDRYFVLHRNYVIYYKPGKVNFKPDDKQEPQGYINLKECKAEETKELTNSPLVFQISHELGRKYLVKAKDDSSLKQFLTLLIARIKSLSQIDVKELGGEAVVECKINQFKEVLPNPLILPDRVSPEMADEWVKQMTKYYKDFAIADPYIKQVEQISELCRDKVKPYIDWFSGPDGPRLAMIRCEETVLSTWVEYISKTRSEITTYEETRFYKEDYEDIKNHLKNMTIIIDSYNEYMKCCRKYNNNNNTPNDRFLEEKQLFIKYRENYNRVRSKNEYSLEQVSEVYPSDYPIIIEAIGERILDTSSSSSSDSSSTNEYYNQKQLQQVSQPPATVQPSTSKGLIISISTDEYPKYEFGGEFNSSINCSSSTNTSEVVDMSNFIGVGVPTTESKIQVTYTNVLVPVKYKYSFNVGDSSVVYNCDDGSEDGRSEKSLNGSGHIPNWTYNCGYFKSKNMGSILWNGKVWQWSHPRTSYKIRFNWDASSQSFINVPSKPRTGISSSSTSGSLQTSQSSMSTSLSSLSTSASTIGTSMNGGQTMIKRSNHPTTLYPDWQIKDNSIQYIFNEQKSQPLLTLVSANQRIPNACLLVVAMIPYIQDALIHIDISPLVLTDK